MASYKLTPVTRRGRPPTVMPRQAYTLMKGDAVAGTLDPTPDSQIGYGFRFGHLEPMEFTSLAAWHRWMARQGHDVGE